MRNLMIKGTDTIGRSRIMGHRVKPLCLSLSRERRSNNSLLKHLSYVFSFYDISKIVKHKFMLLDILKNYKNFLEAETYIIDLAWMVHRVSLFIFST
jgi:hypothetical protein